MPALSRGRSRGLLVGAKDYQMCVAGGHRGLGISAASVLVFAASALLEVAMQSAFQEKCSYTMAVRGLLDGGSVTVRRTRAFAVANEIGRGGDGSCFRQFVSGPVAWYALVTWNPDESGVAFPVV